MLRKQHITFDKVEISNLNNDKCKPNKNSNGVKHNTHTLDFVTEYASFPVIFLDMAKLLIIKLSTKLFIIKSGNLSESTKSVRLMAWEY